MSQKSNLPPEGPKHPEIHEVLEEARAAGEEQDVFTGKRSWLRYRTGTRMEVTLKPGDNAQTWWVTVQSVGGGGFGFRSKRELEVGTHVQVRRWSEHGAGNWLPAKVRHCTSTVGGFVIGIEVEAPKNGA